MNLYEKLIEVRKAVPYLQKDKKGHGFNYVSSSDTIGALKTKMDEVGVLLVPSVVHSEVRDHQTAKGGHNYFTVLNMEFTWVNSEKPEESITCSWTGQGLDSGEKGVGKALTYAEKYFLLKFFNIATDQDDPDSFQQKSDSKQPKKYASPEDQAKIKDLLGNSEKAMKEFLDSAKIKSLADLAEDRVAGAIAYLSSKVLA